MFTRLLPPAPQKVERSYTVDIRFSGNWSGVWDDGIEVPKGAIRLDCQAYRYLGGETGPALDGEVSVRAEGETPGEAIDAAIRKIEQWPQFYPGFLNDATAFEVSASHERGGY